MKGVKWLRKAGDQNLAIAEIALGYAYEDGEGVPKDRVEAAKWYRKAADQNYADGQLHLGRCYLGIGGVEKDYVEGYKWLFLASAQGNEQATGLMAVSEKQMSPEQLDEARKRAWTIRIHACAAGSNNALAAGDYATLVHFLYRNAVEKMGGPEKAIETSRSLIEDLKAHGVSITGIEVRDPERIMEANNKLFAVVPQVVHMEGPTKKGRAKSFIIAVSEDAGKNWSFIDGAVLREKPGREREILAQYIPDFPAELSLPKSEPPVIEPK